MVRAKPEKKSAGVERHPRREEIEEDIIQGMSYRKISEKYGIGRMAVQRYVSKRLAELAGASAKMEEWNGDRIVGEIERHINIANQMLDACREALQDPDDPGKLTLDPTAEDIDVIYVDTTAAVPTRKRDALQRLLDQVRRDKKAVIEYKYTKSDPRRLLLEAIGKLGSHMELMARIKGQIQDATITIINSPTWIAFQEIVLEELEAHPELRESLANRLGELQADGQPAEWDS